MANFISYLKLFRWQNLTLIILTSIIVRYSVIDYYAKISLKENFNSIFAFVCIVLSMVFIAAAGNIINDIKDVSIDMLKWNKRPISIGIISKKRAYFLYFIFNAMGFIASILAAYYVEMWYFVLIHAIVIVLLYLYSSKLKCSILIGNILVSLFVSLVPMIAYLFSINNFSETSNGVLHVNIDLRYTVYYLVIFAFLSNFVREIIKDKEDAVADKKENCITLANSTSDNKLKFTAIVLISFLLFTIFLFWNFTPIPLLFKYAFTPVFFLLFVIVRFLYVAKSQKDYRVLGSYIKIMMLTGVLIFGLLVFL